MGRLLAQRTLVHVENSTNRVFDLVKLVVAVASYVGSLFCRTRPVFRARLPCPTRTLSSRAALSGSVRGKPSGGSSLAAFQRRLAPTKLSPGLLSRLMGVCSGTRRMTILAAVVLGTLHRRTRRASGRSGVAFAGRQPVRMAGDRRRALGLIWLRRTHSSAGAWLIGNNGWRAALWLVNHFLIRAARPRRSRSRTVAHLVRNCRLCDHRSRWRGLGIWCAASWQVIMRVFGLAVRHNRRTPGRHVLRPDIGRSRTAEKQPALRSAPPPRR